MKLISPLRQLRKSIFRPMISLNINLKLFFNKHWPLMYASFLMKNKYSKVAGQFYYLISVMKVHFAARPIARNQHFRLVIVGYSVQNQHKNLLF